MSVEGQMRTVKRGRIYYANRRFAKPGLHLWLGAKIGHRRVLPVPRRWA